MSAPQSVETVSTGVEKAQLVGAVALLAAAVAAYYVLAAQPTWVRVAALLGGIALALVVYFTSGSGRRLIAYARDSWREVDKMVWPTHREALQMTGYVFAFVVVMALMLWLTDKTLEWVLYDLILGWG